MRVTWLFLWAGGVAIVLFPEGSTITRAALVVVSVLLWVCALGMWWKSRWKRWSLLGIGLAVLALVVGPGRAFSTDALAHRYTRCLRSYEGCSYVWGGEGWLGIDCSGLARRGLIDASMMEGILTLNPALIRSGLSLWWHDRSARAMKEEYRGDTKVVFSETGMRINTLDPSKIRPGDMAVTADGSHVLIHLGNHRWIEADPGPMRVIEAQAPTSAVGWFGSPVVIVRWRQLDP